MSEKRNNSARRRARLLWSACALLAVAGAAWWFVSREPSYQGKSATDWLWKMNAPLEQEEAVAAFRAMGKPGIDFLAGQTQNTNGRFQYFLVDAVDIPRLKFTRPIASRLADEYIHREFTPSYAYDVLTRLGPDAAPAMPALLKQFNARAEVEAVRPLRKPPAQQFMNQPYVNEPEGLAKSGLVSALIAMGDKKSNAVPDFVKLLHMNSEDLACVGADLLASVGPGAKSALPAMREQLPKFGNRYTNSVARALWKIDCQTNFALNVFTNEFLKPPKFKSRTPLEDLRDMGAAAKPAVPILLPLLRDSDDQIRMAVIDALHEIDPSELDRANDAVNAGAATNLETLIAMLGGPRQSAALGALLVYGAEAKPAVPSVVRALEGAIAADYAWDIDAALAVIAEIGPGARDAAAVLAKTPIELNRDRRFTMSRALANIGPEAAGALAVLHARPKVRSPNDGFPDMAWCDITEAAATARVRPELKASLLPTLDYFCTYTGPDPRERHPQFAFVAKMALWRLGAEKDPPIARLELPPESNEARFLAAPLLGDLGPVAKSAVPYLEQFLHSGRYYDLGSRRRAALAIMKIDPEAARRLHLPGVLALP